MYLFEYLFSYVTEMIRNSSTFFKLFKDIFI